MSWVIFARSLAFLQDRWQGTSVTNQRPPAAYAKGKRSRGASVPRCYQKDWKRAEEVGAHHAMRGLECRQAWTPCLISESLYQMLDKAEDTVLPTGKRPYLLTRHGRSSIPLRLRKKGPSHACTALYLISDRYCTNFYSQPFLFLVITTAHRSFKLPAKPFVCRATVTTFSEV